MDAVAKADQPAPGARKRRVDLGSPVVLDPNSQAASGLINADHDAHIRAGSLPERVREALLYHAESQVRDGLRDTVTVTHETAGDVQSAAARAGHHLIDKRKVAARAVGDLAATEELDQPLEVLRALPRGLRDGRERLPARSR
jgi:hypothetical protein